MKHLTPKTRDDMHYIAANNIFAFYMTGGIDGAAAEYNKVAEEMRVNAGKDGYCAACTDTLVAWYKASCASLLKDLGDGKKLHQDYPRMQLPPCCGAAA